jgi:hypothetical protein
MSNASKRLEHSVFVTKAMARGKIVALPWLSLAMRAGTKSNRMVLDEFLYQHNQILVVNALFQDFCWSR